MNGERVIEEGEEQQKLLLRVLQEKAKTAKGTDGLIPERIAMMEMEEMADKWKFDRVVKKTRFAGMDLAKMHKIVMDGLQKGVAEQMFDSVKLAIVQLIFPLLSIFLNQGSKVDQIIEKASSTETVKYLKDGKRLFRLTNTGRVGPLAITLPRLGTLFPDLLSIAQVGANPSQFGPLAWYRAPMIYAIGKVIGGEIGTAMQRLHLEAKTKLDSFLKNKARTEPEELKRFAELSIQTIRIEDHWARQLGVKSGALTARVTVDNIGDDIRRNGKG
ncbi:hypothetical protein SNEBB_009974 [Seison nebaliae]|nr:hypothetical protein SNEBB_009974 [Seison nebaliae]